MRLETVTRVQDLCAEVADLANEVSATIRDEYRYRGTIARTEDAYTHGGYRETAALRRRSMDLTRTLADLRQGR